MTTTDIAGLCGELRGFADIPSSFIRLKAADTIERQAAEIRAVVAGMAQMVAEDVANRAIIERQAAEIERLRGKLADIKALPDLSRNPTDDFDRGARAARLDAADMAEAALTGED